MKNIKSNYFIDEAIKESYLSTCCKRQIGAIITLDNKIIGRGCNGEKLKFHHCAGNDPLSFNTCYYESLLKKEASRLKISCKSEQYLTIKKEFKLFCLSICAEKNAIIDAFKHQSELSSAILYCTTFPCPSCALMIRRSGIKRVYFINEFLPGSTLTNEVILIFNEGKIKFKKIDILCDQGKSLMKNKKEVKYYKLLK